MLVRVATAGTVWTNSARGQLTHCGLVSYSWDRLSHPLAVEQQLLCLRDESPVPQKEEQQDADQSSSSNDNAMLAEAVRKLVTELVCPPALSYYADPFPDALVTNNQLVPYVKDAARYTIVYETDELNTHDCLFQNYASSHSLSVNKTERLVRQRTMISWTVYYHKQRTSNWSMCFLPVLSPRDLFTVIWKDKLHLQWPPIKETKRVIDRSLGLYQHGLQPKAGSTSATWPPPTVENPWSKKLSPKDFPTTHKIPSMLPKRWELYNDSHLMLKPPTATAVEQFPDVEISKCSSWLESFAARSAHSSTIFHFPRHARYNSKNCSRNSDLFLRRSTITSLSTFGATQQQQALRPSSSNEEVVGLSCHRRSDWSFVPGILQLSISGSQAGWHLQAHHRSQEIKSLSGHSFVQDRNACLHHSSTSTTRMDLPR